MNEEWRQRIVEAKAGFASRLASVEWKKYHLRRIDRRIESYCKNVASAPDRHCVWELAAVERFLVMYRRYGIDIEAVQRFFRFYEALYFPGPTGPTRYKLTPVQAFQFCSIYGFWQNGRRVVREAVLYVPRKFSKTTSSAAFAVWDLMFGEANAESYTGANSADQAQKCFDVIRTCVQHIDPGARRFTVNEQIIKSHWGGRTAKAQCLTANARTKDGLNVSTAIMDEFSQARDANLLNVLTTSMGVRPDPLTVIITTASDVFDGPFHDMLEGYKKVLLGDFEDDSLFVHLFEPDPGDDEGSEETWCKVHPHMGITVSLDFYRREWAAAQRKGAEAMLAFRTKLLNLYATSERRQWIGRRLAEQCVRSGLFVPNENMVAQIGVDFSKCNDFTAVTAAYYDQSTGRFHLDTRYFFPEGALPGHPNEELYRKWAEQGHLTLMHGSSIDYQVIIAYIESVGALVPVIKIGYDANLATDFANTMRAIGWGDSLFAVPQAHGYFSAPVFSLEKGMIEGVITINDNPINLYCFDNSVLDENSVGDYKPIKKSENQKIDGVITMLMALRQYLYWER